MEGPKLHYILRDDLSIHFTNHPDVICEPNLIWLLERRRNTFVGFKVRHIGLGVTSLIPVLDFEERVQRADTENKQRRPDRLLLYIVVVLLRHYIIQ